MLIELDSYESYITIKRWLQKIYSHLGFFEIDITPVDFIKI